MVGRPRASSQKNPEKSTVEELVLLLEQMRLGTITPADWDFAKRCLARYRARYLCGQLSARSAQRLGLIESD